MNARYYVGSIGRFASADSIVPDKEYPQAYNRYAYALNNPLLHRDPSGHCVERQCQAWMRRWGYGQSSLTVTPTATPASAPATPTPIATITPSPTPIPTPTSTPLSGPLPPPTVPLFPGDTPYEVGYGYNANHEAIDVAPSSLANNNAGVIGYPVNALYNGSMYFQTGDNHRAYLIVGDYQITYSHLDFTLPSRRPGESQWISVTAGQQIGTIMDITKDPYDNYGPGTPNHLHIGIRRLGATESYNPTFLLYPQQQ